MAATLKSRQVDDVIVIDFEGRIVLGGGSSTLRDAVRDLVVKGQTKILLNFAEVSYIDSSGLGELVAAFTTVSNSGGQLKILNLTKRVQDLLQITKLYTVSSIYMMMKLTLFEALPLFLRPVSSSARYAFFRPFPKSGCR